MRLSRQFLVLLLAMIVFMAGLWQGFKIAQKKPLWNDEIYTQVASVEGHDWPAILTGHIREGNCSPLFYSAQKIICAALNYRSDDLWNKDDIKARFILRIAPVFCMSLALALIVWFFCIHYSLAGGLVAFIVSISSYMVWYYWAEARPYALVFLATTIQALALLYFYRFDKKLRFWGIGAANLLLALVSSLSVIQIAASGAVLWFKGCRRIWPLLLVIALPVVIAFGYHIPAEHYSFFFASRGRPLALIRANISAGCLGVFFIFPFLVWVWDRYINKRKECVPWPFFVWAWLTFAGYACFLAYLGFLTLFQKSPQFEVSNRYLMALAPVGIITVSAAILELVKRPRLIWVRAIVWVTALTIILARIGKAFYWITHGI